MPKLKYEGDTSNFDDYPEDDLNKVPGVSEREQRIFDDFWTASSKMSLDQKKTVRWKDLSVENVDLAKGLWEAVRAGRSA